MLLVYPIVNYCKKRCALLYDTYLVATLANINFCYKLTILSSFSLTSLNVVVFEIFSIKPNIEQNGLLVV